MEKISLGKNGNLYFKRNYIGNTEGRKQLTELLVQFFKNTINQAALYNEHYGEDNPLRWPERNTYSICFSY